MDTNGDQNPIENAVSLNWERLQQRFADAQGSGTAWLVECRDMYDALDEDFGVYWERHPDDASVDKLLAESEKKCIKVLGIYDLRQPLVGQGTGLKLAQWHERKR